MSVNVGVSFSSLSTGRHRDGIAAYTANLAQALEPYVKVKPCLFSGEYLRHKQKADCYGYSFKLHVIRSQCGLDSYSECEQAKIDIFHSTDHRIPRLTKVPSVASIFDAIPFVRPEWTRPEWRKLKNCLMRRSAEWPQRVICASEFAAYEVEKYWRVRGSKIRIVPLAVDRGRFEISNAEVQSVREGFGLPERYVLFVGTLQPRKNLRRLIMAHRKLPADMRYEYPLVVVGGDGWLSVKDLSFITDDQCIKRLGYVPDHKLDALYKSAQVLVIPSLHEGFGLPVLEGFAAQIPVICSATTSLGEISQGAAIHFDPLSVDEIYEALKHVLDDEAVRVKSVSEGRKLLKQYSWDKTARETIRVYDEVL